MFYTNSNSGKGPLTTCDITLYNIGLHSSVGSIRILGVSIPCVASMHIIHYISFSIFFVSNFKESFRYWVRKWIWFHQLEDVVVSITSCRCWWSGATVETTSHYTESRTILLEVNQNRGDNSWDLVIYLSLCVCIVWFFSFNLCFSFYLVLLHDYSHVYSKSRLSSSLFSCLCCESSGSLRNLQQTILAMKHAID